MAEQARMAHDALAMIKYDGPAVIVIADSDAARNRAATAAVLAGGSIASTADLATFAGVLADEGFRAICVEAEQDHGNPFDRLLDQLDAGTAEGRFGAVVCAPPHMIDVVAARTPHQRVQHLCNPTERERAEALAAALEPPSPLVEDINRSGGSNRLQQLSEEVGRIANILAELSEEEGTAVCHSAAPVSAAGIRAIIRARRLRDRFFRSDLFADPAWDMMLDLMAARLEGRRVAVSSLCIAAAVPPTTALRWIKTLTEQGLFVRAADAQDGRRIYVELTDETSAAFEGYLKAAGSVPTI